MGARPQSEVWPVHRSHPNEIFDVLDIWYENVVTMCCYYVKNWIFVHITDNFLVTGPLEDPCLPLYQMEALEPPLPLNSYQNYHPRQLSSSERSAQCTMLSHR